jgi:UDP-2-acetamido-3-amino-2,3-dideoxy-glucuronate N-acetyltransferase
MQIAVVGTGYWGVNLVRTFGQLGVLNCVFDADREKANEISLRYGTKPCPSLEEVLGCNSIDAVVIATPAPTHYRLARKALLAGKDVFVEKPITLHCAECEELINLADRKRLILMVGHLLLYHPAIVKLKECIDSGKLGSIEYIYSNRLNFGKVRREENALWSFAPHDISVILYLLSGELPLQVSAVGGTYLQPNIADVTISHMLFDRGIRSHIFVSWLHPYKEQRLVVVGSKTIMSFDDTTANGNKLQLFSKKISLKDGQFITEKPVGTPLPYQQDEPLMVECRHFVDCVQTRHTPHTDGRDGLRVLNVLEACHRSLQLSGAPQLLNPVQLRYAAIA